MAGIKDLKKKIKTLTDDLRDECLLYLVLHPESEPAGMASIIGEIDEIEKELLFRINHCKYRPADISAKKFIDKTISEAEKKMGATLKKMHDMMK
jgi:hypothetical protein